MPSIKIPRKSSDTDMTPFVDVGFLILFFFIMATKFKPPQPVEITTPNSVSTEKVPENDAVLVEMDNTGRVFFSMLAEKDPTEKYTVIDNISKTRNLNLTEAQKQNYVKSGPVGVPFTQLPSLLNVAPNEQAKLKQPGIPIKDSISNELFYWVRDAVTVMAGRKVEYLIKIDNGAKYPDFKRVLEAFKRNEIYKFKLVTSPEDAPAGTDLAKQRAGR
jgi:biopolymer transport protein ExbD